MEVKPKDRLTVTGALEHPWILQAEHLMRPLYDGMVAKTAESGNNGGAFWFK
jgi:hypothetical protein